MPRQSTGGGRLRSPATRYQRGGIERWMVGRLVALVGAGLVAAGVSYALADPRIRTG